jgi:tRNA1Val (adenine37-N6)-methyltransferase
LPNSYFQFKQFTVHQNKCALKVCTDACLFGAWTAQVLHPTQSREQQVLDIGSGTGLLSLMLAQQWRNATIHAIELDANAYQQTKENFAASPWPQRLTAIHTDASHYTSATKYDCIISNPPFFENDFRSAQENKNAAKHDTTLTLDTLLHCIRRNLSSDGRFAILLPYHRTQYFESLAASHQYFPEKKLYVQQTPAHNFFRTMIMMSNQQQEATETTAMSIHDEQGEYTASFTALLKEYYLYL